LIDAVRPRWALAVFVVAAANAATGCDAGKTKVIGADYPAALCAGTPVVPPASVGVSSFYRKYLDGNGIPVLSSAEVSDTALASACVIVVRMVSFREDVRLRMIELGMRVAILGTEEVTTGIPEYRDLYQMFPNSSDWDKLRGVGATTIIPVSSVGEENMLCLANDRFAGERLLVQTFATAVLLGLESVDTTFESRTRAAYTAATGAGLWRNTYAGENYIEYYAEGVQSWFDANPDVSPPDGVHNDINTRAELRSYDPTLAALIEESMPDDAWRPKCP
jgi:hypothetical protein